MAVAARSRTVAAQRRVRAVQLASLGYTYESIAKEVGYGNRGTAYRAVRDELERCSVEAVDTLRRVELDRLEALQRAVWDRAMRGDVAAVNAAVRIIESQIRLLGLDQPESKRDAENASTVVISPEELQQWLGAAMERAGRPNALANSSAVDSSPPTAPPAVI